MNRNDASPVVRRLDRYRVSHGRPADSITARKQIDDESVHHVKELCKPSESRLTNRYKSRCIKYTASYEPYNPRARPPYGQDGVVDGLGR